MSLPAKKCYNNYFSNNIKSLSPLSDLNIDMDRKDFIIKSAALCGTASVIAIMDSCQKQSLINFTIDLTLPANAALNRMGGYIVTQNNVFIIKTNNGYNALSLVCTHAGCTVSYNNSLHEFICPCHGGTFNINGAVIGGPPPSALTQYTVTANGNILTVKG